MTLALVLLPALAGVAAFFIKRGGAGRMLLVVTALAQTLLTLAAWLRPELRAATAGLALDALGLLVLTVTSILFLAAAATTVAWLRREPTDHEPMITGCLLLFLAAMTLVTVSRHFGLLWVAVEGTTLASAPLIYFHRTARSLEATWKYLLICSVGIALAMLGNLFLAVSAGGHGVVLSIEGLTAAAGQLDPVWLRAAFLRYHIVPEKDDVPAHVDDVYDSASSNAPRGFSQAGQAMAAASGFPLKAAIDYAFPAPNGTPPEGMPRWNNPTFAYRALYALSENGFPERAVAHLKERYAPYMPGDPRNRVVRELQGPYGGPLPEYWVSREDLGLKDGEPNPAQPVDDT
ncbi:MAG TPA: hypothetical protein PKM88_02225, partial [bacterium]|nr:hypothetical protein [bacterium]